MSCLHTSESRKPFKLILQGKYHERAYHRSHRMPCRYDDTHFCRYFPEELSTFNLDCCSSSYVECFASEQGWLNYSQRIKNNNNNKRGIIWLTQADVVICQRPFSFVLQSVSIMFQRLCIAFNIKRKQRRLADCQEKFQGNLRHGLVVRVLWIHECLHPMDCLMERMIQRITTGILQKRNISIGEYAAGLEDQK